MMGGMFWVIATIFVLTFSMVFVGMAIQMVMFGKLFGMVVRRIEAQTEHQRQVAAALAPIDCPFCHGTIPANTDQCPGCGANR